MHIMRDDKRWGTFKLKVFQLMFDFLELVLRLPAMLEAERAAS